MTIEKMAELYAKDRHRAVNHYYGDMPYEQHLQQVVDVARRFIRLIPERKREGVIAACWCHDLIEDARETYNDVRKNLGTLVAEVVFALTTEKGRTRKDRASAKYYQGIRDTEFATFVKLCDRIANWAHSIRTRNSMSEKYKAEYKEFRKALYSSKYIDLWDELDRYYQL